MFKKFSQVGRAMMLPIAILPLCRPLLGFRWSIDKSKHLGRLSVP